MHNESDGGRSSREGHAPHAHGSDRAEPSTAPELNALFRRLPDESYARLLPHLEPLQLPVRFVLWEPDAPIEWVYFPRTAVCSILVPLVEDGAVEAATVGREGFLGVPVALEAETTATQCICQIPGEASRLSAGVLRQAVAQDVALRRLVLRYAQALHDQTAQSVACNARHEVIERCARWLLMTLDRVERDEFPLTHEFLAMMMGVRRATVTVSVAALQRAGLIRTGRGRVRVLDRAGLEATSCECYRIVQD